MQSKQHGNGRQISLAVLLTLFVLPLANSQEPTITPNYRDADIRQIVEAVGEVTGKNFILDPRVNAKVTMLSSTPMSPDAFYEAFLSILQVSGYVAMTTGDIIKIIPDATARQYSGILDIGGAAADEIVTQVVQVQNVGASQLVPILRPLIPQYGHLAAHPGSNILIISDRASNVDRMLRIIRRIDQSSDDDIEVVRLEHASASEVVRILTALTQVPRSDGLPVNTSLVSDSRSNSVLIGGDKSDRLRLRALIAHLDTPLQGGGNTQVRYLRYADAEELATKLQQHFAVQAAAAGGAATTNPTSQVSVWSDPQNNAIVVNAPPKHMRSLMSIVDKLDIRRAQVLIEAIIVEVIEDRSSDLGVTWAVDGSGSNSAIGITDFPGVGTSILGLGTAFGGTDGVANPAGLIGSGITLGVGRITDSGTSFAAILNALRGDANTNIISTPTIVTTDNEEATLSVGQEVPFLSGSFANTGGVGGAVNPFQTIQREQVGVKLTITPQINEGTSLLLKISQEVSSIASSSEGAADLITNERTIDTTVIVEDGGILVLGGLVEETLRENDQRVPVLGSIPILGNLFRNRSTDLVKTNLMVFIRAKILRDSMQTSFETNAKYNAIRNVQQGGRVELMPGANRPVLPPVESYEYAPSPTTDDAPANDR